MKTYNINILLLILLIFTSCETEQSFYFQKYENEFEDDIVNKKSEIFDYQYDGLSPQTAYIKNCKLTHLKLKDSGELSTSIKLITFENDSISKIIEHFVTYVGNDNGNTAGRDLNKLKGDTIYIYDYKNLNFQNYVKGKLLSSKDSEFTKRSTELSKKWIYKIKDATEKKYNCL